MKSKIKVGEKEFKPVRFIPGKKEKLIGKKNNNYFFISKGKKGLQVEKINEKLANFLNLTNNRSG